jgi:hypothetical protein
MKARCLRRSRSGHFVTLTVAMLVGMFGMVAFAVDLGYLHVVRTEMQRAADSTAIAATWELIDPVPLDGQVNPTTVAANAATVARRYAELNRVAGGGSQLDVTDITLGRIANPTDPSSAMTFADPTRFNAVKIRFRRTAEMNGEVPLFFAKVLGVASAAQELEATAAFIDNFNGFKAPANDGETLGMLPIALDKQTWDGLLAGGGTDSWTYNAATGAVTAGGDGIREINLYPQGTGSPGNRGTVDIGSSNNSTADLARQILYGVSKQDLDYLGGELKLNANGQLPLNGDTGISAGVKDELAAIKGQPRIIPIFSSVSGPGNNATYTIVKFAGVRIVDVKLTGSMSSKRVIIQPAAVTARGVIPETGDTPRSNFIYSPVWLVR